MDLEEDSVEHHQGGEHLQQEFQPEALQSQMHTQIVSIDTHPAEIQVSPHEDGFSQFGNALTDSSTAASQQSTSHPMIHSCTSDSGENHDHRQDPIQYIPTSIPAVPARFFLELFSGKNHRFSSYIQSRGVKTLQPLDILIDDRMNILDDKVYHSLLRLVASKQVGSMVAAPPCTEYSLLKLQQPGPLPCRSPECMDRPLFDTEVCHKKFFDSREIIHRTVNLLELQHIHGGYSALEQPLSAMTWDEPIVKQARTTFLTETAVISHCRVLDVNESPLNKHWQFVSDIFRFHEAELQCTCEIKHSGFAGKRNDDGSFASSRTAEYPYRLVQHLTPFLRLDEQSIRDDASDFTPWERIFSDLPRSPPVHFQHIPDGAGLVSSAVWPLPFKPDVFYTLRKELEQIAIGANIPTILYQLQHQRTRSDIIDQKTLFLTSQAFQFFFLRLGNHPHSRLQQVNLFACMHCMS